MRIYKIAQNKPSIFDLLDTTKEEWEEQEKHKIISEPKQESIILTLYRGFNHLPNPNPDGTYTLSPDKSEQKSLWFAHNYMNIRESPLEFAKSYGKYLLTYPLKVTKHFQIVSYDNNKEYYHLTPKEIQDKTNTLENCRFYSGIELPEGWLFSYKTEKFIVCTIPITITKDMLKVSAPST